MDRSSGGCPPAPLDRSMSASSAAAGCWLSRLAASNRPKYCCTMELQGRGQGGMTRCRVAARSDGAARSRTAAWRQGRPAVCREAPPLQGPHRLQLASRRQAATPTHLRLASPSSASCTSRDCGTGHGGMEAGLEAQMRHQLSQPLPATDVPAATARLAHCESLGMSTTPGPAPCLLSLPAPSPPSERASLQRILCPHPGRPRPRRPGTRTQRPRQRPRPLLRDPHVQLRGAWCAAVVVAVWVVWDGGSGGCCGGEAPECRGGEFSRRQARQCALSAAMPMAGCTVEARHGGGERAACPPALLWSSPPRGASAPPPPARSPPAAWCAAPGPG